MATESLRKARLRLFFLISQEEATILEDPSYDKPKRGPEMLSLLFPLLGGDKDVARYALLSVRHSSVDRALHFATERNHMGLYEH